MLKRVAAMKASGVQFVTLLALSDEGAPAYDREHAAALAVLDAPAVRLHARPVSRGHGGGDREAAASDTGRAMRRGGNPDMNTHR